MLTTKRLIELGFIVLKNDDHWYLEKSKFCLFPMNGSWAIGSNLGELATGVNGVILFVDTEQELLRYLQENDIKILDN